MNQINILIVDDERRARQVLLDILSGIPGFMVMGEASGADEAFGIIKREVPDVILLDIQMPLKDGFDLVEMIRSAGVSPKIIFVTAFDEFAIRAIKASAFDYILKPVKKAELMDSLGKLRNEIENHSPDNKIEKLVSFMDSNRRIRVYDRNGFNLIDPTGICWVEASGNYSCLHFSNGTKQMVSMNIGKVEAILNAENFIRASRSSIINLNYLTRVDRRSMTCVLKGAETIRISVSRSQIRQIEERCG